MNVGDPHTYSTTQEILRKNEYEAYLQRVTQLLSFLKGSMIFFAMLTIPLLGSRLYSLLIYIYIDTYISHIKPGYWMAQKTWYMVNAKGALPLRWTEFFPSQTPCFRNWRNWPDSLDISGQNQLASKMDGISYSSWQKKLCGWLWLLKYLRSLHKSTFSKRGRLIQG